MTWNCAAAAAGPSIFQQDGLLACLQSLRIIQLPHLRTRCLEMLYQTDLSCCRGCAGCVTGAARQRGQEELQSLQHQPQSSSRLTRAQFCACPLLPLLSATVHACCSQNISCLMRAVHAHFLPRECPVPLPAPQARTWISDSGTSRLAAALGLACCTSSMPGPYTVICTARPSASSKRACTVRCTLCTSSHFA